MFPGAVWTCVTHLYRGDDVALAAVQGLHLPHVLLRQTEVAHLQVLQDSGRGDALGDADHAPLDLPPADQSRCRIVLVVRQGSASHLKRSGFDAAMSTVYP